MGKYLSQGTVASFPLPTKLYKSKFPSLWRQLLFMYPCSQESDSLAGLVQSLDKIFIKTSHFWEFQKHGGKM